MAGEHDLEQLREDIEWAMTTGDDSEIEVDLSAPLPETAADLDARLARAEAAEDWATANRIYAEKQEQWKRDNPQLAESIKSAGEQRRADETAGRAAREEAEAEAADEELARKYGAASNMFGPFHGDNLGLTDVEWGARVLTEKGVNTLVRMLDDGLDPEGLEYVLGDLAHGVELAQQQRQERDTREVVTQLTSAHKSAVTEHGRLASLNQEIAPRAAEWIRYMTEPQPPSPQNPQGAPPIVNLLGATDADGNALALAGYRLADWERDERAAAEQRLQHAIAVNSMDDAGNVHGDEGWFFNTFLPDLAKTDPDEYHRQLQYILPREPDERVVRGMFDPLSIPLSEVIQGGVPPSVTQAHMDDLGRQVAAMTGIEYDAGGANGADEFMGLVSEANRQLAAEQRPSNQTPDEVMADLQRSAIKAAEAQALEAFRQGRR
jgi:hypothetical protein